MTTAIRMPKVLVPYSGPSENDDSQDVFVYLRPETNGVLVESILLKVIENCPAYRKNLFLVYLANIPGDFIVQNHIVEQHYAVKIQFAVHGKRAFTSFMREKFEQFFKTSFSEAPLIGSFEALDRLKLKPEDLFHTWVSKEKILKLNGQSIKKIGDYYVVNYDIPALLHRNNRNTDIAVMIFRVIMPYEEFQEIVELMRKSLTDIGMIGPNKPPSRVFHYSKGPFEQVLDGIGYLYQSENEIMPLKNLSFPSYLIRRGVKPNEILGLVKNYIIRYRDRKGEIRENSLFSYTERESYADAYKKLSSVVAQVFNYS